MSETAASILSPWSNFYVITGSAAAGLTGLMFVVITLVAGLERSNRNGDGIATFSTPTVVHLCVALLVSAGLSAPWKLLVHAAAMVGLTGAAGIAYVVRVTYLMVRQTAYKPEFEDWVWFAILPLVAYVTVLVSALLLVVTPISVLFVLAGAIVLLILIGIRNAWDIVTYLATGQLDQRSGTGRDAPPA
jgi:hypothetical protein